MTEQTVNAAFNRILTSVGAMQVDPQVGMAVIRQLNQRGQELRIWVDTANAFGHHATTMLILKRFVAYGLTAPVRVFCDSANAQKLELFLPGYKAGDQQLTYKNVQISFQYDGLPPSKATLLVCGGSEASPGELEQRLAAASCSFYLQLQPWNWKSIDRLFYLPSDSSTPQEVVLDGQRSLLGPGYSFCAYTEPAQQRDDQIWDEYAKLQRFATRVAMAKLLADAAPNVLLLPTYGLGSRSSKWNAIVTLTFGCLAAQDLLGQSSKPIILLAFDGLGSDEGPLFQQWVEGTAADDDYPEPLRKYAIQKKLASRFGVQYQDDLCLLKDQLSYLKGNRLLVVSMPQCPDEIFRFFYSTATLPCVYEGRGTQNLVLNRGKPFLCTNPDGYPSLFYTGEHPPLVERIQKVVSPLQGLVSKYDTPDSGKFPSTLFATSLVALLSDQAVLTYFQALGEIYGRDRTDKLRMALRFLRQIQGFPL